MTRNRYSLHLSAAIRIPPIIPYKKICFAVAWDITRHHCHAEDYPAQSPSASFSSFSAGSLCHRKLLSSFIIFKSRGHMKNFLHILFVCFILNRPLEIHAQQQASLHALKSESCTNTAQG